VLGRLLSAKINRVTARREAVNVCRMHTTHALLAAATTPARGPLHAIRLRTGRPALASAT
jgi:hypothetical protein